MTTGVRLTGQLVCRNAVEATVVRTNLPEHSRLTRAEPGCVSFDVEPTDDPLVWQVDECFTDEVSFRMHQTRVADSTWGRATDGIERRYVTYRVED